MFSKIIFFGCVLGVAFGAWHGPLAGGKPADLYPAGVSPHSCPNYPHCANPAVAAVGYYHAGHGHGQASNDGKWQPAHSHPLYTGKYTGDGDYRGEGLAESGAFGPVHHGGNAAYASAYNHHGHVKYPAGVSPHACPNYPYCH